MEQLAVTLPGMWADHHVLTVRKILIAQPGVHGVFASARDLRVIVEHDPARAPSASLIAALEAAGYAPGNPPSPPESAKDKPAWATAPRVTSTDAGDAAMSGDYRQY